MVRKNSLTSRISGVLGLVLIVSTAHDGFAAAAVQRDQARVVTIGASPDRHELPAFTGPPRGIRTFGKGAVRPETPHVVTLSEFSGAGSVGAGVDATHKISGSPMAGSVAVFAASPDGATVVYIADQDTLGLFELYSVAVDGSAAPTKISDGLAFGAGDEGVFAFQITPNSAQVVFLADPGAGGGVDDIFSVPIGGSTAPVQLNSGAEAPVTGFGITPDSASVAFFGIDTSFGSGGSELYRATIGTAATAVQLSDVGDGNPSGDVVSADFSPDSARAIYAGDGGADEVFQWYSVPLNATGPGSDVLLSAALGSVGVSAVSPDSARVVYTSDDNVVGRLAVYSKRIQGGAKTQLNPALAGAGVVGIAISPDSARVCYLADQDTADVIEVYSALMLTSASGVRLNTPMGGTQLADTLNISPDSTTVLYEADQDTAGTFELFGVPIDASASPMTLHPAVAPDNAGFFTDLGTPIFSTRAVYPVIGDNNGDPTVDLFSVPYDGSAPFTQISAPLTGDDVVLDAFLPISDTRLMAYGIGSVIGAVTDEIYSVPMRGDLAPEQLNVTASSGALGVQGYEITSDDAYGVYLQDQDTLGKPELYSKELDSDQDTVINGTDNCPFVPNMTQADAVFPQTILATTATTFGWSAATDVSFVRGPLDMVSVLATDDSGTLADAMSYTDSSTPVAGSGFYYLFAPDCTARSWQTVEGAEPARDSAGFP